MPFHTPRKAAASQTAHPNSAAWMDLSRAHHSDCAQPSGVYMRDATAARGLKHVCEGRAGGPQGSALTCIVFPILLDGILKATEQQFPGVEIKAIQDDVDLYGDPAISSARVAPSTSSCRARGDTGRRG